MVPASLGHQAQCSPLPSKTKSEQYGEENKYHEFAKGDSSQTKLGVFSSFVFLNAHVHTYGIKTEKSTIRKRDLKRAGKEGAAWMSLGPKGTWGGWGGWEGGRGEDGLVEGKG